MNTFKALFISTLLFLIPCLNAQTFSDSSIILNPVLNNDTAEGGIWGASAADFNNDGRVDIFHEGRLYLNEGENGFNNIIETAGGIDATTYGAIFGDYNNDGYLDIFMEDPRNSGGNFLFKNKRNLSFSAADMESNISVTPFTQGSAWGDFNLDGKLDLFVGNDFGFNQLFKNVDYEIFQDISSADIQNDNRSYGIAWGDFNNDLYPDMFIAPCHPFNARQSVKHLYLNNGDETFTDVNISAGVNDSLASWGIIWLNYNNDAFLDIFIANTEHNPRPGYNKLYRNNGDNTFSDVSDSAGVSGDYDENSFGAAAADFDNDGWIDIYVANEFQTHRLYKNNGDGTFTDIANDAGISENRHKAVAVADYNNDGWVDIFTAGAPANSLLLNNGGENHWLTLKTRGVSSNHFGIGTRIELYTQGMLQIREVNSGDSFCSQNDNLNIHFGLGAFSFVDSIIVKWPAGGIDVINNVSSNQRLTIAEGIGINNAPAAFSLEYPEDGSVLSVFENTFSWENAINNEPENVSYNLYIYRQNFDTVITDIADTSFSVNLENFQPGHSYNWIVDATDGYSITASLNKNSFILDHALSIADEPLKIPSHYILRQNYPNPFNPGTIIEYTLPKSGHVTITIFDLTGKEITTLVDQVQKADSYAIAFEPANLASAVYIYRLDVDNIFSQSKKMIILR